MRSEKKSKYLTLWEFHNSMKASAGLGIDDHLNDMNLIVKGRWIPLSMEVVGEEPDEWVDY